MYVKYILWSEFLCFTNRIARTRTNNKTYKYSTWQDVGHRLRKSEGSFKPPFDLQRGWGEDLCWHNEFPYRPTTTTRIHHSYMFWKIFDQQHYLVTCLYNGRGLPLHKASTYICMYIIIIIIEGKINNCVSHTLCTFFPIDWKSV